MPQKSTNIIKEALFDQDRFKAQADYWLNVFSREIQPLELPADFIQTQAETGAERRKITFSLSQPLSEAVLRLSKNRDITLYIVLLTAFKVFLSHISGADEIWIGSPLLNPDNQLDKEKIYNRRVLFRDRHEVGKTFKELLLATKTAAMDAYKNQDYPLELAIKKAKLEPQLISSLERTFFLLTGLHDPEDIREIPFYWSFVLERKAEVIALILEYDTSVFLPESIEALGRRYLYVLEQCSSHMDTPVHDLDFLTSQDKERLHIYSTAPAIPSPPAQTIHAGFEAQAALTPEADAVVDYRSHRFNWSYSQLNLRANRIFRLLRESGIVPGNVVALMMEPGAEVIATLLAILKCGAIYMPIDPAAPAERLALLLKDSNARLLITREHMVKDFSFTALRRFNNNLATPFLTAPRDPVENLDRLQMPDRSWVDYGKYRPYIGQAMMKNCLTVQFSRGCVFKCAYCFKVTCGNYHARSAENMFDEIKFHYDLGVRRFAFVDDLPNLHIDESSKLYRLIIQHKLDVQLHYVNGIRADILTPEYIDLMVEAGTVVMDLALETTSKRLQKLIRKNLNVEKFHRNIRYIIENYPHVILETAILHGIPTETEEEALQSLEYLKRLKWVHFPYIHLLKIYPNTEMEQVALNNGISREAIRRSATLAYHEIPETIPFTESFTRQYQADFLSRYFLNKERLLSVLPAQMKVFTEDELVQAYNGYLPVEIDSFEAFLKYAGIDKSELSGEFLPDDYGIVKDIDEVYKKNFPAKKPSAGALKVLLLDLTQSFSAQAGQVYDVVEPPLGLLYVMSHLHRQLGGRIHGKIMKSRIDFDGFNDLKAMVLEFQPDVIGIRCLNYYADFFHKTVSMLRMWGCDQPVVAGGPYASSSYDSLLKDPGVDLAVIGEGEETFVQLLEEMLTSGKYRTLPPEGVLKKIPGLAFISEKDRRIKSDCGVMFLEEVEHRMETAFENAAVENPAIPMQPADPAYIIYTSGSTGTPKGVLASHDNLVNQLHGLRHVYGWRGKSLPRFMLLTALTFDVSLMHIFTPLLFGAPLYIVDEETKKDPALLWKFISQNQIGILNTVPAFMRNLTRALNPEKVDKPVKLDYIFIGGEAFPVSLYHAIRDCEYLETSQIVNIYGPTETTINAAVYPCKGEQTNPVLPIGKPLPNYSFHVLDNHLNLLPPGIAGELFIGGKAVTHGYLNNPELTQRNFPTKSFAGSRGGFSKEPLAAGGRLYRTGDLVRWLPDGNLEFLGRIDRQVKVRGFRIELGEIESRLLRHDYISDAAVVKGRNGGDPYLSAYYVPHQPLLPELWPSIGEYFIWDELMYYAMTHDQRRNIRFRAAVDRFVRDKTVVEVGTGRDAILARFCAEAGAKKVYAVELLKEAAENARETVKKLGLDHIIQVIHGDITRVSLPEAVDICIANQCGTIGSSEGAIILHNNARRFLKEENRVIPSSCLTKMAAVRLPGHLRRNRGFNALPGRYVEKIFAQIGSRFDLRLCIKNFPISHLASDEAVFEDLDFMSVIPDESSHDVTLTIKRDAVIDGFLLWLNLYAFQAEEGLMDTLAEEYVWLPLYIPVFYPGVEVSAGDVIEARCIRTLSDNGFSPDYRVTGTLNRKKAGKVSFDYSFPRVGEEWDKRQSHPYYRTLFHKDAKEHALIYLPEQDQRVTPGVLRHYLEGMLPGYMVPSYFVPLDKLPRTPSGKLDTPALPDPLTQGQDGGPYIAPGNLLEEKLVKIWTDVLYGPGTEQDHPVLGIADNFFQLGGHSLKATILSAEIQKALNIDVPVAELFRTPTIQGLSRFIAASMESADEPEPACEMREYYEVSEAQRQIWITSRMETSSTAYHMPGAFQIEAELDQADFQDVLYSLVRRHEALRTSIIEVNGRPVQRIHQEADIRIEPVDVERISAFFRPFDLSRAPLMRVGLGRIDHKKRLLLVDLHHIVADGISVEISISDFGRLMAGETLESLDVQYKEYVLWRQRLTQNGTIDKQLKYWRELFDDGNDIPLLNMPGDFERPAAFDYSGGAVSFDLEQTDVAAMTQLSQSSGITTFMHLTAILNVLLFKFTGQPDIIIGAGISGRSRDQFKQVIGMFVNTLPVRVFPAPYASFNQLLEEVKESVVNTFEHGEVSFQSVVEELGIRRDPSRNPLFDVALTLQTIDRRQQDELSDGGLTLKPYPLENRTSKFDLTLLAAENQQQGTIHLEFEYCAALFKLETIRNLALYFQRVVRQVYKNPDILLEDIDLLSKKEKTQLLQDINAASTSYPRDKTIPQLFQEQVEKYPHRAALIFRSHHITYKQLDKESGKIAEELRSRGVGPNAIVALKEERGLEMITGIMGILKAGGAYLPIETDYPRDRIDYMLNDSAAILLIHRSQIYRTGSGSPKRTSMPGLNPTDLAYIIYTSGTTGKPKGVMTSHRNAVRVVKETNYIDLSPDDRLPQLSNYAFDGSVFDIYGALLNGSALVLVGRDEVLAADRLMDLIRRQSISVFFVTTALFNTLVDLQPEFLIDIRKVLFGGERVSVEHCIKALSYAGPGKIVHVYGPTETTVYASYYPIDSIEERARTIPIGRPLANTSLYILDRCLKPVPPGVPGELYIGGEGLASGYLNNPELTIQKFIIPPSHFTGHSSLLYKTGDLVCWNGEMQIEFIGRVDRQVKIRGFRIELGEIESQLLKIDHLDEVIVVDIPGPTGERFLCAYIVSSVQVDETEIKNLLAGKLPVYMVPSHFIQLERLPLNRNGKVDQAALPKPDLSQTSASHVPPANELETRLVEIWCDVLYGEPADISVEADFFQLGGHSLKATMLLARIRKELGIDVPLKFIFSFPYIRSLARYIEDRTGKTAVVEKEAFSAIEKREYYPLSSAQVRMYLLQQMNPQSTAYNLPLVVELEGTPEPEKLEQVFHKLIRRHETLRTSFHIISDQPVQKIHTQVPFELGPIEPMKPIDRLTRPFELSQAPLLRASLMKKEEQRHVLVLDVHHIVMDGVSLAVLVRDFAAFYRGGELPPLPVQYKDFACWQSGELEKQRVRRQEKYWLEMYADDIPVLELPCDFPRSRTDHFNSGRVILEIGPRRTAAIKELASSRNSTLFVMLLALFHVFFSKLSGQDDLVIGSPTAGRRHDESKDIIGMFVNMLALRQSSTGSVVFSDFLKQVRASVLAAFENQDYQFEDLVDALSGRLDRNTVRNPLFDVVLSWQNIDLPDIEEIQLPGIKMTVFQGDLMDMSRFDISINVREKSGCLLFTFIYNSGLFRETTVKRFTGYFDTVTSQILDQPDMRLDGYSLLDETDRKQILEVFNDTAMDIPGPKTLQQCFSDQVLRTPSHLAVAGAGPKKTPWTYLSYAGLEHRAAELALQLSKRGAGPGAIVAVRMKPSVEMIAAIMAVLRTGAAYLPVDPDYPRKRINYMTKDSGAGLMIDERGVLGAAKIHTRHEAAYVLYTSGSTGHPKGVMVGHPGVVNLVHGLRKRVYEKYIDGNKNHLNIALVAPFVFDASVKQIFVSLLSGYCLHLAPPELRMDGEGLLEFYARYGIDGSDGTPVHLALMTEAARTMENKQLPRLKHLLIGGEALPTAAALDFFAALAPNAPGITNVYGPTECTVDTTSFDIDPEADHVQGIVPIGRPMPNVQCLVSMAGGELAPPGVPGELCVLGHGLAIGYINRPQMTAKYFVQSNEFGLMYKTGDRCRWMTDLSGNLEFLGRVDQQVKIRGFRVEPGEIEHRLLRHKDVKAALVIPWSRTGGKWDNQLCAYIVPESSENLEEPETFWRQLQTYLSGLLPSYMVPVSWAMLTEIPVTRRGKVDRRRLPEPGISGGGVSGTPVSGTVETSLANMWSDILKIEFRHIDVQSNFFDLGGHSMGVTLLTSRIQREFNVKIPLAKVFENPTIQFLSAFIKESSSEIFQPLEAVEKREYYPVTSSQKRFYMLHQLDSQSVGYNTPLVTILDGQLDINRLENALDQIVSRHETLRTSFELAGNEPVQRIHDVNAVKGEVNLLEWYALPNETGDIASVIDSFVRPFDLGRLPLMRLGLLKLERERHLLMWDKHHIITDATASTIFIEELPALYRGEDLPALSFQYKEFAYWHHRFSASHAFEKQEQFWLNEFSSGWTELNLPLDYPRPSKMSFDGRILEFRLTAEETAALKALASAEGVTMFMLLTAVLNILLWAVTRQEDIILGTTVMARGHADVHRMMGVFLNTIALRNFPSGEMPFRELLSIVKQRMLEVLDNQDYPFETLVNRLDAARESGRNPIFDVMFVYGWGQSSGYGGSFVEVSIEEGLTLRPYEEYRRNISPFDLYFSANDTPGGLDFSVGYGTSVFKEETVKRFMEYFKEIIRVILKDKSVKLNSIEISHNLIEPDETEFQLNFGF